ncbi:hypothetical protein MKEN_00190000 [Mycena kentingensis (nom. inval.)]|nr:hypothetical protein MKEN_00190000 [Mycena kentingensis (nom. inval.)]
MNASAPLPAYVVERLGLIVSALPPSLDTFELSHLRMSPDQLIGLVAAAKTVKTLVLDEVHVKSGGTDNMQVSGAELPADLTTLHCTIDPAPNFDLPCAALARMRGWQALQTLSVGYSPIFHALSARNQTYQGLPAILGQCTGLQRLCVHAPMDQDIPVCSFAQLVAMPTLELSFDSMQLVLDPRALQRLLSTLPSPSPIRHIILRSLDGEMPTVKEDATLSLDDVFLAPGMRGLEKLTVEVSASRGPGFRRSLSELDSRGMLEVVLPTESAFIRL